MLVASYSDPIEFAAQVLSRVIIKPTASAQQVMHWERPDVELILKKWANHPLTLQKDLTLSGDVLESFKAEITARCEKSRISAEKLSRSLLPKHLLWTMDNALRLQRMISPIPDYTLFQRVAEEQQRLHRLTEPMRAALLVQRELRLQMEALSSATKSFHDTAWQALTAFQQQRPFHTNIFTALPDPFVFVKRSEAIQDGFDALDESGYGFTGHVWDLPLIEELGGLDPGTRGAAATNRFAAFTRSLAFHKELEREVEGTPVFRRRWPIIGAALDAHTQRNYVLAIPTLLAQLEGCITDALVLRGEASLYRGKLYARTPDGKVKKGRDKKRVQLTGLDAKLRNSRWKEEAVLESISALIVDRLTGSRNRILHGRDLRYARPKLSTQCILLIWVLCREIRERMPNTK